MGVSSTVVIADAGPIIHLDELASLDLLADFGKVIVPETVWQAVQRHRPQALQSSSVLFIRQSALQFSPLVYALAPLYTLHAGEQEALHLCLEFTNYLTAMELEILQKPETLKIVGRMSDQLSHHLFDTFYHALALETDSIFIMADEKYFNKAQTFGHIQLLTHYSTR